MFSYAYMMGVIQHIFYDTFEQLKEKEQGRILVFDIWTFSFMIACFSNSLRYLKPSSVLFYE